MTSSVSTLFPEEAVNEVKRQAMSELQKAVSEAERKAHEMISSERAKMERTVAEAKRQAAEDALIIINQQEDSSEVGKAQGFWNRETSRSSCVSSEECDFVVKLMGRKINMCKFIFVSSSVKDAKMHNCYSTSHM